MIDYDAKDIMRMAIAKIAKLELVAMTAAEVCIDHDHDVNDANRKHMEGEIANGAFQHVLRRNLNLHHALMLAGFTEKHPVFDYPVRPKMKYIIFSKQPLDKRQKIEGMAKILLRLSETEGPVGSEFHVEFKQNSNIPEEMAAIAIDTEAFLGEFDMRPHDY